MSSGTGLDATSVPVFRSPEAAAIAVARAARDGAWRARDVCVTTRPAGIVRVAAAAIMAVALGSGGGWLPPDAVGGSIPATTPASDALSRDLKRRGFRFVGSTIVYAFMQSVGLVDDHLPSCFRYRGDEGVTG